MSTALLLNTLEFGGAERVASNILKYYSENKKKIILILFLNRIKLDIPDNIEVISLNYSSRNNLLNLLSLPILAYRLAKILKQENISYCFSLTTRPNYVNVLSSFIHKGIKHTISERSCPSQEYSGYSLKSIINRILIKSLYQKSNSIICNSLGNKYDLINIFNIQEKKIQVINNPIDINTINKIKKDTSVLNPEYINFISVGRLDSNKNFKMMIDVFSKVKLSKARLYIIGSGIEFSNLNAQIKSLGIDDKVFLLGEKRSFCLYKSIKCIFIYI